MIIVRRYVSFMSKIIFHVSSGIKCAPMLEILLPDGQRSAQGSCPRLGNFRKGEVAPKSWRATSACNIVVALLRSFQIGLAQE